jgi:hypothetical protein
VSTETIYQSLYVQSRGALRRELTKCLRTGRALRQPGRRAGQRKNRIPEMVKSPNGTQSPLPLGHTMRAPGSRPIACLVWTTWRSSSGSARHACLARRMRA